MSKLLMAVAFLVSAVAHQDRPTPDVTAQVRDSIAVFEKARQKLEMALLELGPAAIPELERISGTLQGPQKEAVRESLAKIKQHREPIEKLIAGLGGERIEARDKATAELRRIGRPARPYLEAALRSENPEVRARSKMLLVMISPQDREKARWAAIADALGQRLGLLERQMKDGTISSMDLLKAKGEWLRARRKAGQITLHEYLKEVREPVERNANLAQVNFQNGVITRRELMAARIRLLYLDRRLGKSVDPEIETLQLQWMELARADKERAILGESEMLKELAVFLTDPDEDLDD